jgi:putative spermidine/putrescine transport system permease protein
MIVARATAAALLAIVPAPLVYAVWISFSPGELLEPPAGAWSLRWYRQFFENPQWTAALRNSFEIAVLAVAVALAAGSAAALAVTRYHFRGQEFFNLAIMLPLFVPAVVMGMALLPFMRALGLWGSKFSIAVAHGLWSLPVVFLVTRSALEGVDSDLERAARGLGAGPIRVSRPYRPLNPRFPSCYTPPRWTKLYLEKSRRSSPSCWSMTATIASARSKRSARTIV